MVLDVEGVCFLVDKSGGGGVPDGKLLILALVVLNFGGEMVSLGVWSWGKMVSARDNGSLESLASNFIFFFELEASSLHFLFCFKGTCVFSLSSSSTSSSISTSLTILIFPSFFVFRRLVFVLFLWRLIMW